MSADAPLPSPSSSPISSARRSLLARLTSPLRNRSRNLPDFHIELAEPHRRYVPGDSVKGIVCLTVVKPIRITHLTVALHGVVRVFRGANGSLDPAASDNLWAASGSSRRSRYLGHGQASLFQDEIILCGDGRLEVSRYEFEFNLEFPGKDLPSNIDFERGTISYMVRATITRPTTIAATSSCDRKIAFRQSIDIGMLPAPKPRTISLEPISKRSKRIKSKPKLNTRLSDNGNSSDKTPTSPRPHVADNSVREEILGQVEADEHPPSPARTNGFNDVQSQSENSEDSVLSSSTGVSFMLATVPSSAQSATELPGVNGNPLKTAKTITAKMELLKAGCLPGDTVPVRITIKHIKWIKSMHGIIITLYRQGRIDYAPPIAQDLDTKGKSSEKAKREDYYPKSKTGLGGLSLTSAGSSSVFRKDLVQIVAPIILDPRTLSTIVNASIRIPEDVFPTIRGVIGDMISFKYHVEIVVDLGGKLAGQDRHRPRLGMMNIPSVADAANQMSSADAPPGMLSAWGNSIVNTDSIRRETSVVACLFEIVVGTQDTGRLRTRASTFGKHGADDTPESPMTLQDPAMEQETPRDTTKLPDHPPYPYEDTNHDTNQHYHTRNQNPEYFHEESSERQPFQSPSYTHPSAPPPEVQNDHGISEKERIRRAEERHLPSQPPPADGPSSSRDIAPSAPPLFDGDHDAEDLYSAQDPITPQASFPPAPRFEPSAPSASLLDDTDVDTGAATAAHPQPAGPPLLGEDKQELERRRLMAEASSPADFPADFDDSAAGGEGGSGAAPDAAANAALAPSAPLLTEEDEYGGHYAHAVVPGPSGRREDLPAYER